MKASSGVLAFLLACGPPLGGQVADTTSPEECMRIARAACDVKDYPTALDCYRYVLSNHPDYTEAGRAAVNVGYIHANLRDLEAAEAAFRAAVQWFSGTEHAAEAQTRLGYVALARKEPEAARSEFLETVLAYPQSPHAAEAELRLGYLALQRRAAEPDIERKKALRHEAAESFAWVVENHAEVVRVAAEAYAQYAGIFFEWGMDGQFSIEEVRNVCRSVLASFPSGSVESLATAQLMLAETYLMEQRNAEALAEALRVPQHYLTARTQAAYAYWVAGQALERMGRHAEAIQAYDGVLVGDFSGEDNFKDRDIHSMCAFRTAQCLRRTGQYAAAGALFEYVIEQWPESGVAGTARRILWTLPPTR